MIKNVFLCNKYGIYMAVLIGALVIVAVLFGAVGLLFGLAVFQDDTGDGKIQVQ